VGSSPDRVKPRTIKLILVAFPLGIKEKEQLLVGSESGCVRVEIQVYPWTVVSVSVDIGGNVNVSTFF
jgi:hypothetical protein